MKKKIVALCLVVAMLAIAIVGGTMAYFTDTEAQTNVFTVGEIKIDLYEDFDDATNMLPAVGTDHVNQIKKIVNVENEGKNGAYVRVHIAFPVLAAEVNNDNDTTNNIAGNVIKYCKVGDGWTVDNKTYETTIGKVAYEVFVFTYNKELTAADEAKSAIDAVYLESAVTQDDIAKWNTAYGEGEWAKVYVYAEGVQAAGFNSADTALDTAFGVPGEYTVSFTAAVNAANEAQLINALNEAVANVTLTKNIEATGNLYLNGGIIDGNGKILNKENTSYNSVDGTVNAGIIPTGGTIKNITISGESFVANNGTSYGFRAVYVTKGLSSNLYIDGATLKGTYAINIQDWEVPPVSTGALIVEDTTLDGWISYDGGITGARFTDCKFITTGNYAVYRPYIDTVLTSCDFASGYTFGTGDNVNNLVIELTECTVNGAAVTAQNFANLFNVEEALKNSANSVIVDGVKVIF